MAKVFEVLADAFVAEGVDHNFVLIGDANMYWADALARKPGVKTFNVRHEHAAVGMAAGYARSTGKVGVCSVTNGPGLSQVITELTVAARARLPLVLFAGDVHTTSSWSVHQFDQQTVTIPTGAHFIAIHSLKRMLRDVRDAFYIAKFERRPVVISIAADLQEDDFPYAFEYETSSSMMPRAQVISPDPVMVTEAIEMLANAQRPMIIAGRGAIPAREQLEALAEQSGALLSTTMLARGLFDGRPFNLGMAGGLSGNLAYDLFNESDLVIAFGGGIGSHTADRGKLFPKAKVIQVDINPRGLWQGRRTADLHVQGDAKITAERMLATLKKKGSAKTGQRTVALGQRIAGDLPDSREFPIPPNTLDPRAALLELDRVIPKDWDIVCGVGHYFHFVMTHLSGRAPERYHPVTDFGAIGSALPQAMGIAAARKDGKVVLIEGDGSMMLHIQEFDTIKRESIKMLMCVFNDGGYGAEYHKFRAHHKDESEVRHGLGQFPAISRAFGLRGETVTQLGSFEKLFSEHQASNATSLWDVHIADTVPSLHYRRLHYKER